MKLILPRFMYSQSKEAVLVKEEKDAEGLFIKPPHKWAKDEKAFEVKAPKSDKK